MHDVDPPVHAPASFGRRLVARLFDVALVAVVAVPVLTLTLRGDDGDDVRFPMVVIVLYGVLPALYEAWMLVRRGTTPGKRLSGLVVETTGGDRPGWPAAIVRSVLAWSVPALAVLLLDGPVVAVVIVAVFGAAAVPPRRRDLPDRCSGTCVRFIGEIADEVPADDPAPPTDA